MVPPGSVIVLPPLTFDRSTDSHPFPTHPPLWLGEPEMELEIPTISPPVEATLAARRIRSAFHLGDSLSAPGCCASDSTTGVSLVWLYTSSCSFADRVTQQSRYLIDNPLPSLLPSSPQHHNPTSLHFQHLWSTDTYGPHFYAETSCLLSPPRSPTNISHRLDGSIFGVSSFLSGTPIGPLVKHQFNLSFLHFSATIHVPQ